MTIAESRLLKKDGFGDGIKFAVSKLKFKTFMN